MVDAERVQVALPEAIDRFGHMPKELGELGFVKGRDRLAGVLTP